MRSRSPAPSSLGALAARVDGRLADLLDGEIARWRAVDPTAGGAAPGPGSRWSRRAASGCARRSATGRSWARAATADDPRVVDAGAAFEMLHAFALVHDDVMDGSDIRRGRAHRPPGASPTSTHAAAGGARPAASARARPSSSATWPTCTPTALMGDVPADVADVWHELRLELNIGQYLDLVGHRPRRPRPGAGARRIARYKSGKYTIERPLHVGAALAGAPRRARGPALSAYGDPLGEAFQLRDDLLGAFGDPIARASRWARTCARASRPRCWRPPPSGSLPATGRRRPLLDRVGAPGLTDADVAAHPAGAGRHRRARRDRGSASTTSRRGGRRRRAPPT